MASRTKKRQLKNYTYFRQEENGPKTYVSGDYVYLTKDEIKRLEEKDALVEEEKKKTSSKSKSSVSLTTKESPVSLSSNTKSESKDGEEEQDSIDG